MRLRSLFVAGVWVLLACGGGPEQPLPEVTPPAAPAAPAVPAPAAPSVAADRDAGLADHWLVILGSKTDPTEVIPGVATLAAHPEVPTRVRQILSSRFKNLMPCYTVTIADATPDKKAALALSKQLKGLGVDNYVKNAGAWVGRNAAIDAYCAADDAELVGDVRIATLVGDALWVPVATSDAELAALVAAAPAPEPRGDGYDAWYQPIASAAASGARYRVVDASSGRSQLCTSAGEGLLTLGTPHFGYLQGGQPQEAPTCGSPARFEQLACPESVATGRWIVVPEAAPVAAYSALGAGGPSLVESAKASLTAQSDWDADPDMSEFEGEAVQREVTVTRWRGPQGELAVVQGVREVGNGMCGGDRATWYGVYALAGDSLLGTPLGDLQQAAFVEVEGLVDLGADGRPDVLLSAFPTTFEVVDGTGGTSASLAIEFCDCPC